MKRARYGFCLLTATLFLAPGLTSAEDWFGPPIVTDAGQLSAPELAHLNGDQYLDLVCREGDHWDIYLGQPGMHFVLHTTIPGSTAPDNDCAIIDENGDGILDLVTDASSTKKWRNDGSANFTYIGMVTGLLDPFTVGDLDGNGWDDLGASANELRIIYGYATGLDWAHPQTIDMSESYVLMEAKAIAFADLNADGHADLVECGTVIIDGGHWGPAILRWALGLGNHQFGPPRELQEGGENSYFRTLDFAYLDVDLDLDVSCAAGSTANSVFYYDESTNEFMGGGKPFGGWPTPARLRDFNGDGATDALVTEIYSGSGVWKSVVFESRGMGAYVPRQELVEARLCAVGDISRDGSTDVVSVKQYLSGLAVWPNIIQDPAGVEPNQNGSDGIVARPTVASDRIEVFISAGTAAVERVMIYDLRGALVTRLTSSGNSVCWDLRDSQGQPVPSGLYWLSAGNRVPPQRVVVLR